jgi:hypothetical protein
MVEQTVVIGAALDGAHHVDVDHLLKFNNKIKKYMETSIRIERPAQVIKSDIQPLDSNLKVKIAGAVAAVVNAIKAKHLS